MEYIVDLYLGSLSIKRELVCVIYYTFFLFWVGLLNLVWSEETSQIILGMYLFHPLPMFLYLHIKILVEYMDKIIDTLEINICKKGSDFYSDEI